MNNKDLKIKKISLFMFNIMGGTRAHLLIPKPNFLNTSE